MSLFIGIDIGGTKCAVTLARVDGGIHFVDKIRFPSLAEEGVLVAKLTALASFVRYAAFFPLTLFPPWISRPSA